MYAKRLTEEKDINNMKHNLRSQINPNLTRINDDNENENENFEQNEEIGVEIQREMVVEDREIDNTTADIVPEQNLEYFDDRDNFNIYDEI
jgi:hypothetical protein